MAHFVCNNVLFAIWRCCRYCYGQHLQTALLGGITIVILPFRLLSIDQVFSRTTLVELVYLPFISIVYLDLGASQGEHIQASTLWSYLTSHQDIEHLSEWVDKQYGSNTSSVQPSWPYHLPLSTTLIDDTSKTTDYVKDQLLNMLAR